MGEEPQKERVKLEKGHCHTQKWFLTNYGVDPLKLPISFKEVENPYYSLAPPMKLWNEADVSPYRDQRAIDRHRVRSQAAKKGAETRKKNLAAWFEQIKSDNPRVKEITKRLWEIGREISDLHSRKEECRKSEKVDGGRDYSGYGDAHCDDCAEMTDQQESLRFDRERLFAELERICQRDKQTIQLARRNLREGTAN